MVQERQMLRFPFRAMAGELGSRARFKRYLRGHHTGLTAARGRSRSS